MSRMKEKEYRELVERLKQGELLSPHEEDTLRKEIRSWIKSLRFIVILAFITIFVLLYTMMVGASGEWSSREDLRLASIAGIIVLLVMIGFISTNSERLLRRIGSHTSLNQEESGTGNKGDDYVS